jgi:hypothetical protein
MDFNSEDIADLHKLWKEFDAEMTQAMDRICLKYADKLDAVAFNDLGYRNSNPEDKFLRFNKFCEHARVTYLIPSMEDVAYLCNDGDRGVPEQPESEDSDWDAE